MYIKKTETLNVETLVLSGNLKRDELRQKANVTEIILFSIMEMYNSTDKNYWVVKTDNFYKEI